MAAGPLAAGRPVRVRRRQRGVAIGDDDPPDRSVELRRLRLLLWATLQYRIWLQTETLEAATRQFELLAAGYRTEARKLAKRRDVGWLSKWLIELSRDHDAMAARIRSWPA